MQNGHSVRTGYGKVAYASLDEYLIIDCKFSVPELGRETYRLFEVGHGLRSLSDFKSPQTPLTDLLRFRP